MLGRTGARRCPWARIASLGAMTLLVPMTLAACGSDSGSDGTRSGEGTTTTAAGGGSGLAGTTFVSTSVDGYEPVEGTQIRLTFDDERMGANAGCNTMAGLGKDMEKAGEKIQEKAKK